MSEIHVKAQSAAKARNFVIIAAFVSVPQVAPHVRS